MKAVKRPGSLYFSMIALFFSQADFANFGSMMLAGSRLLDWALISSIVAAAACSGPASIMSRHFFCSGSAMSSGLPALISGIAPMPSEWSVTAIQSSGREASPVGPSWT